MQRTRIMRMSLVVGAFLLSSCGGDSDAPSQAAVPALHDIAGAWTPVSAAAASVPIRAGQVVDLVITPDGFVALIEEIPTEPGFTPSYRDYFGVLKPTVFGYSGTLNYYPPASGGLDPNNPQQPLPGPDNAAEIQLVFSSEAEVFGELQPEDGSVLQFALAKNSELTYPAPDPDLVGTWKNFESLYESWWTFGLPQPPTTSLTFDDAGNGVGIYQDVCMLEANMTGLVERLLAAPGAGGGASVGLLHHAELAATGCVDEGNFSGVGYVERSLFGGTSSVFAIRFYLLKDEEFVTFSLVSESALPDDRSF